MTTWDTEQEVFEWGRFFGWEYWETINKKNWEDWK
jgi:hypothetical protein